MFLFISYFKLFAILASSGESYLLPKRPTKNRVKFYTYYCIKTGKKQQWDDKIKLICIANKDIGARVFRESHFLK